MKPIVAQTERTPDPVFVLHICQGTSEKTSLLLSEQNFIGQGVLDLQLQDTQKDKHRDIITFSMSITIAAVS